MKNSISVVSLVFKSTKPFKYLRSLANPFVPNCNKRKLFKFSYWSIQLYFPIYNGYLDLYNYHIWCHTWWDNLHENCIPVSFHLYLGYTKTQQILLLEKQFDPHKGMLCPHHPLLRTRNFLTLVLWKYNYSIFYT